MKRAFYFSVAAAAVLGFATSAWAQAGRAEQVVLAVVPGLEHREALVRGLQVVPELVLRALGVSAATLERPGRLVHGVMRVLQTVLVHRTVSVRTTALTPITTP